MMVPSLDSAGPMLAPVNLQRRNALIVGIVLALHVLGLWALQSGLLRRAVEIIVPVALVGQVVPPAPVAEPTPPEPLPPQPAPRATPPKPVAAKPAAPAPAPAPQPLAVAQAPASPSAPTGVTESAPVPAVTAPVAATAPPAPPARVEPPVLDADYAANEEIFRPPPAARRAGEHGTVVLKVTVGTHGMATDVELARSSGSPRLDTAALQGARLLRFKPATRAGQPIAYTYLFPIQYAPPR
jgi:protein TonB